MNVTRYITIDTLFGGNIMGDLAEGGEPPVWQLELSVRSHLFRVSVE